jgi:hypothetical protein
MPRPALWPTQGFFRHRLRDQGKKQTTHLHLVLRLGTRELTPSTQLHGTHRDTFTILWTHATSRAGMTNIKNLPKCESVHRFRVNCVYNNKFILTFLKKSGYKVIVICSGTTHKIITMFYNIMPFMVRSVICPSGQQEVGPHHTMSNKSPVARCHRSASHMSMQKTNTHTAQRTQVVTAVSMYPSAPSILLFVPLR